MKFSILFAGLAGLVAAAPSVNAAEAAIEARDTSKPCEGMNPYMCQHHCKLLGFNGRCVGNRCMCVKG
ncbi:hypothetical protein CDD81_203 [Ophiocordyceps australis]|uniref:Invertebrate defensins family profile domain-containing protein n=1 Tax=Ophiocordyceps australis TaxID=1399860 RepID=A0A2C5YF82_9HYPO|nr:hypothetical protein CDD81_203 [Ophiocordyceps australis]